MRGPALVRKIMLHCTREERKTSPSTWVPVPRFKVVPWLSLLWSSCRHGASNPGPETADEVLCESTRHWLGQLWQHNFTSKQGVFCCPFSRSQCDAGHLEVQGYNNNNPLPRIEKTQAKPEPYEPSTWYGGRKFNIVSGIYYKIVYCIALVHGTHRRLTMLHVNWKPAFAGTAAVGKRKHQVIADLKVPLKSGFTRVYCREWKNERRENLPLFPGNRATAKIAVAGRFRSLHLWCYIRLSPWLTDWARVTMKIWSAKGLP